MQFLHRKCVCIVRVFAALTAIRYVQISYFHQIGQSILFVLVCFSSVRLCYASLVYFLSTNSEKQTLLCNGSDRKNWLMYAWLNWRPMFHKPTHTSDFINFLFSAHLLRLLTSKCNHSLLVDVDHHRIKVPINFENLCFDTQFVCNNVSHFVNLFQTSSIAFTSTRSRLALCNTLRWLYGNAANGMHSLPSYAAVQVQLAKRIALHATGQWFL